MSLLECNLSLTSKNQLIYEKPYEKLRFSERDDGGILISSTRYEDIENTRAFETSMYFFDEGEKALLLEWLRGKTSL